MRGIENGFATVEQTSSGLSASFDDKGNVLSKLYNNDVGDTAVMVSQVPTKGTTTVYARVGDVFTWLCIGTLLVLFSRVKWTAIGTNRTRTVKQFG